MNFSDPTLFDHARMTQVGAIDLTAASLREYGSRHDVWAVAYSGGKDSTALVTAVTWLIETGRVPQPRRMYVLYGDTRMELPPLAISARRIMGELSRRDWIECRTVMASLDHRFFVYMLGRGVPPPNNKTLRWCTSQIKVKPMQDELSCIAKETQQIGSQKPLMLIGVRIGESAARDQRIAIACSRDGAECGQGWYQRDLPDAVCDKLSPILHWRTCLVWDWLAKAFVTGSELRHDFSTQFVAEAYGLAADASSEEIGARTGCVGCPLAQRETALDNLIKHSPKAWGYLAPLKRLRPLYRELRLAKNRLRQPPGEARKDGSLTANQNRMGPLTLDARRWALAEILSVQDEINLAAKSADLPSIDLLNSEEESRIRELIAQNTWPNGWTGDEPLADLLYEDCYSDGSRQSLLPILSQEGNS